MFLATERLLLRRFTEDDVDNLEQLDRDPDVMRFVTGGRLTPRDEIENEVLPAFLGYYERFRVGSRPRSRPRRPLPRVVPLPTRRARAGRRGRARLPAPQGCLGEGYATEGSRALVEKGFAELDVVGSSRRRGRERRVAARAGEGGLSYIRTFHAQWPYRIDGDEEGESSTRCSVGVGARAHVAAVDGSNTVPGCRRLEMASPADAA